MLFGQKSPYSAPSEARHRLVSPRPACGDAAGGGETGPDHPPERLSIRFIKYAFSWSERRSKAVATDARRTCRLAEMSLPIRGIYTSRDGW